MHSRDYLQAGSSKIQKNISPAEKGAVIQEEAAAHKGMKGQGVCRELRIVQTDGGIGHVRGNNRKGHHLQDRLRASGTW